MKCKRLIRYELSCETRKCFSYNVVLLEFALDVLECLMTESFPANCQLPWELHMGGCSHVTDIRSVTGAQLTLFANRYMVFGEQGAGEPGLVFDSIHCDLCSEP